MQTSKSAKAAVKSPTDKLSRIGRKVGVQLTESQLGQATGGATGGAGAGKTTKINF